MTAYRSTASPRPRTLVHPGAFNPIRMHTKGAGSARHFRLSLQPGVSLYEGLVTQLASHGVENASTTILGGYFERLTYCTAPPDPRKEAIIAYTAPISAGAAYMVFGNATLGKDMQDRPIVHCHAAIRMQDGRTKGGHIIAQDAIVGSEPVSVLVTSLDGFDLRVAFDPETNISLMQPEEPAA